MFKDIYKYQIFGDKPEKKKELDEFFKSLDMKSAQEKREQIQKKKVPILNEAVEFHNKAFNVSMIVSLGVNYLVKEKKKEIENILNGSQSMSLSFLKKYSSSTKGISDKLLNSYTSGLENISNKWSDLGEKMKSEIDNIMKTITEDNPELRNIEKIKERLIDFTKDIKLPSDIFKKIKELPTMFDNLTPKGCVDNPDCYQFLDTLKKEYGSITEDEWNKIHARNLKKEKSKERLQYLNKCNQEFQEKKKFCSKEPKKDSTPKDVIISPSQSIKIVKSLKDLENKFEGIDVQKDNLFSSPEQKKKVLDKIQNSLISFEKSVTNFKISDKIKSGLGKINPLSMLKGYFKEIQDVIDGFGQHNKDNQDAPSMTTSNQVANISNEKGTNNKGLGESKKIHNSNEKGVNNKGLGESKKIYIVNDDFEILSDQKLSICKHLRANGVRVNHGLLNYVNNNDGNIKGVIMDISYDNKIGQIKFDDSNVYWIPLELGSSFNNLKIGGFSKRKLTKKNKKYLKKERRDLNQEIRNILIGGNTYMWQIILPVYDLDAPCELPPPNDGPKGDPLPEAPLAGGGDEKKEGMLSKLKNIKLFKKKEEKPQQQEQKIKFTGERLQDNAKVILTTFRSLVLLMEKNTHFKFIYYFVMNVIYKFIKTIKEIANYSRTAVVPGNKKTSKYLVYLGKLICINTENFFNLDLLQYSLGKIDLVLDSYELDIVKKINNLIRFILEEIFKFNNNFCQYTANLELELAKGATTSTENNNAASTEPNEVSSTEESSAPSTEESKESSTKESKESSTKESSEPSTEEAKESSTKESSASSTEEAKESSTKESSASSTKEPKESSTKESSAPSTEEPKESSTEEAKGTSTEEAKGSSTEEAKGTSTKKEKTS